MKPTLPAITTKGRPTIAALGLARATVHADYNLLDRASTDARADMQLYPTFDILPLQEKTLEMLITSIPATNLAEAAMQLGVAVEFADRLYGCDWDDASTHRDLAHMHAALSRITLSVLPIVAEAAGLDMDAMNWDYVAGSRPDLPHEVVTLRWPDVFGRCNDPFVQLTSCA